MKDSKGRCPDCCWWEPAEREWHRKDRAKVEALMNMLWPRGQE